MFAYQFFKKRKTKFYSFNHLNKMEKKEYAIIGLVVLIALVIFSRLVNPMLDKALPRRA